MSNVKYARVLCTVPEANTCAPTGASPPGSTNFALGAAESVYAHVVGLTALDVSAVTPEWAHVENSVALNEIRPCR
jgi:hypothetical protein